MGCINSCIFTGRITQTVELKTTKSGKSVCTFRIANEQGYGEKKKVYFPTFIAWNGQAEFVSRLSKGTMVAINSTMTDRDWESKSKEKHTSCEFVVREIQALEPKKASTEQPQADLQPTYQDYENPPDDDLPF